jgi:hypothetical protein
MDIFLFLFLGVCIGLAGGMHWSRVMTQREMRQASKDIFEMVDETKKELKEFKRDIIYKRPARRSNAVSLLNVLKV